MMSAIAEAARDEHCFSVLGYEGVIFGSFFCHNCLITGVLDLEADREDRVNAWIEGLSYLLRAPRDKINELVGQTQEVTFRTSI